MRYRPIRDYAAIGDCHGSALVSAQGSIDWCCLRRHDADPVFWRLLDSGKGGFWAVAPAGPYDASRSYRDGTNILQTSFRTPRGEARLIDLMPVGRRCGAGTHDYVSLRAPHWIIRRIEALAGEVEIEVAYRPERGFGGRTSELRATHGGVRGEGVPELFSEIALTVSDATATGRVTLRAGEHRTLVLADTQVQGASPLTRVDELIAVTEAFWREWIGYCRYRGEHADLVRRSALALKLMTYAPSGALVAALTTSLPEAIGAGRNWDYRYCWLRDSAFALYALSALGYGGEAAAYVGYLGRCARRTLPNLRIMYGIEAEVELDEVLHDGLDGYAGSRPVRTGNGAAAQRQLDVYGQILDLALLFRSLGGRLDRQDRRLLEALADLVAVEWREPDQGMWEIRGPPQHHVHGKLMAWVAADRARQLLGDPQGRWAAMARAVAEIVHDRCADGHLRQSFGSEAVDASSLLTPMLGFPARGDLVERTVDAVMRELRVGDAVYRYRVDDGLAGEEGAFMACGFWLVDALLAIGRAGEARQLFAALAAQANDVGLYAEEIDPTTAGFLGNFPQAFTHLGLVGSAVNLQLFERHGRRGIQGSYADRARLAVGATFGWRAVLAAMLDGRRLGRLRSSWSSILLWP